MATVGFSENKKEINNNKTIDEKEYEEKLSTIFKEQYDENIEDILILEKDAFLKQIKERVQYDLEEYYHNYFNPDENLTKLIRKYIEETEIKYDQHYSQTNRAWEVYANSPSTDNLLTGFRKHCINTEEYASHNCCRLKKGGESKKCHFICVYNLAKKDQIDFVICEKCKKVYYSSYILSTCNICNVEYYTSILSPDENPDMLLATWKNYHCQQIVNEKMKCIKCRELFYINMKNGLLTCLNKKCQFTTKPSRILWTCAVCKFEFKSDVIPYNPLEIIAINKLIEQTILLNHKAHPARLPCCKSNVFFTDFYHKKECDGKLYENEIKDKIVVVCEKCHYINYFERFAWTCPKCGKRFRDKNFTKTLNNKFLNCYKIRKKTEKNVTEKKEKYKDCFTPKTELFKHYRRKFLTQTHFGHNPIAGYLNEKKKDIKEDVNNDNNEDNNTKDNNNKDNNNKDNNSKDNNNKDKKEETSNKNDTAFKIHKKFTRPNIFKRFHFFDSNNKDERANITNNDNNKERKGIIKKSYTNIKSSKNLEIYGNNEINEFEVIEKKEKNDSTSKKGGDESDLKKIKLSPRIKWKKRKEINKKKELPKLVLENENVDNKNNNNDNHNDDIDDIKKNISKLYMKTDIKEGIREKRLKDKQRKLEMQDSNVNNNKENSNAYIDDNKFDTQNEISEKEISNNSQNKTGISKTSNSKINENSEEHEHNKNEEPEFKLLLGDKLEENEVSSDDDFDLSSAITIKSIQAGNMNMQEQMNKRITDILNKCKIPRIDIANYMFDKNLGEGGYAAIFSVYKIDDESYKEFAMKKILGRSIEETEKFTKEFELVYSCDHPNIMKIYGITINMLDPTTFSLYVLMEIAKRDWNTDIKRHLKQKKNYPENELINILRQLINGLLYLQKQLHIAHRDIKPQNILLFPNNVYKIADFGEAKEIKISKGVNTLRGTELYMSPALYSGLKEERNDINHNPYKSDVFSLGLCFIYAATLNFDLLYQIRKASNNNQMNNILKQQLKKKYTQDFIEILSHMMDIDENKRYDFTELIDVIDAKYDENGDIKNKEK